MFLYKALLLEWRAYVVEVLLHPFSSSSLFCQLAFGTVSLFSSSREENNTSDVILSSFERPGYSSFVVEKFFGCPLWSHLAAPYVLVPWEHSPLGSFHRTSQVT